MDRVGPAAADGSPKSSNSAYCVGRLKMLAARRAAQHAAQTHRHARPISTICARSIGQTTQHSLRDGDRCAAPLSERKRPLPHRAPVKTAQPPGLHDEARCYRRRSGAAPATAMVDHGDDGRARVPSGRPRVATASIHMSPVSGWMAPTAPMSVLLRAVLPSSA